ncbi:MAG: hypothetical protein KY476_24780 [Planctomycetes bacterium]|nr:hypothetical protein [Planctomycetota bacterium]
MEGKSHQARIGEFPALLPIGRHELDLAQLHTLCVDGFPESTTRAELMHSLEDIATRLRSSGVRGELWIGGSFVTEKLDPDDVDVVLRRQASSCDDWTLEERAAVDWLASGLAESHRCDTYLLLEWPESHPDYWFGEYMYAYWLRQWGFGRDNSLKGIAVIKLEGETT